MRVLILGCGYVGSELGRQLSLLGHQVVGLRRSSSAERVPGVRLVSGDIADRAQLAQLPGPFDWVVNTVSSSRGGLAEYQEAYLSGTRSLLTWLTGSPLRTYVYTSSTSVYGQTDGSLVDETSAATPQSATGKILLETERILRAATGDGFPAVILRVAGIYGPGRGHLFQQYLRDEARITNDGSRFLNMIHRDDVAGAIIAALNRGVPGELYNAVDDEPVSELNFFTWLSGQLRKPLPPRMEEGEKRARKRASTNKRVSNKKLRGLLGYTLRYPTFREGYAEEIQRLT